MMNVLLLLLVLKTDKQSRCQFFYSVYCGYFYLQTQPTLTKEVKANQKSNKRSFSLSLSLSLLPNAARRNNRSNKRARTREQESKRKRKPEGSYERVNQAVARKKRTRV